MKENNVSIIILNYNDFETTSSMINMIKTYNDLDHIIIVDNNSTDGSFEKLKSLKSKKIDLIKNTINGGYGQGNNFGVKYAINKYGSKYIIISNPDVIFSNSIVNKMVKEFEKDDKLGIVSPDIEKPNKITYYNYNYLECICSLFLIVTKIINKFNKKKYGITNFFPGSFFMIDSDLFLKVGGFDENTFLYCEEIILNKKINEKGKYSKIFKNFTFIHNHSTTINKNYKSVLKPYRVYIKSMRYYLKKYLKINIFKLLLFYLFVIISYIERIIYDFYKKILIFVEKNIN